MVTAIAAIIDIITKGCIAGFFLIRLLTLFLDLSSNFEELAISIASDPFKIIFLQNSIMLSW